MLARVITKHKQQRPSEWQSIYARWRAGDFHNNFYAYFYRAWNGWSQPGKFCTPAAGPTRGALGLARGGWSLRTGHGSPFLPGHIHTHLSSSQWPPGPAEPLAALRGVAAAESPAQLLPDLRHGNILQHPSLSLQVGYVSKLSFTTTELQTSYVHFLGLFFCCSANWHVFFRTMKLRSGYNYRNPSYPSLPVSLMKPWILCNFLIPNCLSVWQI